MKKTGKPVLIITTVPNYEAGKKIAHVLVEEHLVACVNIIGQVDSVYSWKDEICEDKEYILFMKTISAKQSKVFKRIKQLHSYEVPELVMIEIKEIGEDYFNWMKKWINGK
ncbi:MAG: hypothetical protein A2Y62_10760 [Candidatus Fischerbacteria bacterium RBG_13_37_8]|uniref:Cation tolerance protein CutA n=1 Tax=Candidatus Fischerbacteria bacterium RBG_13_37_8 TaxID=1817863 RepID=A0A1F5VUG3_9BACT|nr:MAG: hypothetical protein A2Y62_10760 [Candidatus Fischerbacteria bacterium RBG_13_37_8]